MRIEPYKNDARVTTRWSSFENPQGLPGMAGMENGGAKGRAFRGVEAGATATLLSVSGSGVVRRMWLTVTDRSPRMLRALRLEMYWDGSENPAVSVPLGDFFLSGGCAPVAYETHLFANPEGRSFNCFIPMPFVTGARIVLVNDSDMRLQHLFYDINYTMEPVDAGRALYFHAHWNRESPTSLCRDYTVLNVAGEGRFLGVSFGVIASPAYGKSWFGEGEMKMYLDGDAAYPTLCGTGTEDYIGTAWGQGKYAGMTQGSLYGEAGRYAFYRLHTVDPVYFYERIRVTMQDIGGCSRDQLLEIANAGARYKVVSRDSDAGFAQLYEQDFALTGESPEGWYNFYREDDYSSVAYFYLDRPASGLPICPELSRRLAGIDA